MVGQSGIASASAASAVAQRYREADSIQAQRVAAKTREFAAALPAEPSVINTVGSAPVALLAPPRLAPDSAVPAKPVIRSVLASPALAKRGSAAYEAAAAVIGNSGSGAEAPSPSNTPGLSLDC